MDLAAGSAGARLRRQAGGAYLDRAVNTEGHNIGHVVAAEAELAAGHAAVVARRRIELDHDDVAALGPVVKANRARDVELEGGVHAFVAAQIVAVQPDLATVIDAFKEEGDAFAQHCLGHVELGEVPNLILLHPFGAAKVTPKVWIIDLAGPLQIGEDIARDLCLIPVEEGALILGCHGLEALDNALAGANALHLPVDSAQVDFR